ncbi:EcsC family protein [Fodinibacter luteus]|uniref:EcsC family protein n=1 Tax=Fodinibacter luteus TaxID=552064 RepID=A0ABP8KHY7_9MICO
MGFPGIGGGRTSAAVKDVKTALEQAQDGTADEGVLGRESTRLVQNILDLGLDGKGWFDSADHVADEALRTHGDAEAAVDALVRSHVVKGGAAGFVTSLGGFFTMPVALPVNLLGFYLLATRMTASVARVRGYDLSSEHIRTAVLLTLVGADADDLLRKANVAVPGGTLSNLAVQRLPGPALMVVQKGIGFRLLAQVGTHTFARLGRLVPFIGGAIGAGLDAYMLRRFAANAKRQFPPVARAGATAIEADAASTTA